MQPEFDEKKHKAAAKAEISAYRKLVAVGKSKELDDFFDFLLKTVTEKMVWSFTSKNIKSWEEFLEVRAEIVSYLYPLQEVRGAESIVQGLEAKLQEYYGDLTS